MSDSPFKTILDAFNRYEVFLIFGHEDPDADCLGSQRALGCWLARKGKTVHLCSSGPWKKPEMDEWREHFLSRIPQITSEDNALIVLLDCNAFERTGFQKKDVSEIPSLVIDHHATSGDFGDIRFIDSNSPSTTLLVQRIIEAAGDTPTLEEAHLIFLGFCTDTGFFRHVEPGFSEPLEAVSRLVGIGVSPSETFRWLTGGKTLGSRKLLGRALERVELYFDGRVAMTWENWKDCRELGRERDSDMLYQLLTSIAGVEVVAVIREQNDGMCIVGLRCITDLDVSAIAQYFGGGGHKKAAGCSISGDRHDAIEHLSRILADRLS